MSILTRADEPVVSRVRFIVVTTLVWGGAGLIFVLLLMDGRRGSEGLGVRTACVVAGLAVSAVLALIYGFIVHGVNRVARRPGVVWAGTAVVTPAQLTALGAQVLANGVGSLTVAMAPGSAISGVLSLTSASLVWEPRGNGSGVRATTLEIPLSDIRSMTFALRTIRLAQVLNLRVTTDLGVVDFGIANRTRGVRAGLRRVGAANLIHG